MLTNITLMSFGFKYGRPNANYYFDVGFLKNPARVKPWDFFSEVCPEMVEFIREQPETQGFLSPVVQLILFLKDVDTNNVMAFGCSGGRHRSPIIVDIIDDCLTSMNIYANIIHRDKPK